MIFKLMKKRTNYNRFKGRTKPLSNEFLLDAVSTTAYVRRLKIIKHLLEAFA